jgi:hypothetical protein
MRGFLLTIERLTMTAKEPSKSGRPSSYKPEYPEQATQLCRLGATDAELAKFFDVALSTFHKWKLDHPEFSDALKEGKELSDARVAHALYTRATGYEKDGKHIPPDTTACIFWLKNRRKDKWRDKNEDAPDSASMADVLNKLIDKLPD